MAGTAMWTLELLTDLKRFQPKDCSGHQARWGQSSEFPYVDPILFQNFAWALGSLVAVPVAVYFVLLASHTLYVGRLMLRV